MTTFAFEMTVPNKGYSTALGVNAAGKFDDKDLTKPVVLGTAQNHVLASAGEEIAGFVIAIEPYTVNDGFSFGSIQKDGFFEALVGANQGVTDMAIGDLVVADVQVALNTDGEAQVKTGTPATYKWQCVRIISGAGAAGSRVLLARV